jgi:hypothetical protein
MFGAACRAAAWQIAAPGKSCRPWASAFGQEASMIYSPEKTARPLTAQKSSHLGKFPMKRLLLAGLLLVLLVAGYYFVGSFFETRSVDTYEYTLQSENLDELNSLAPVVEAQLRRLPVLQDVSSDLQVKNPEAIGNARLMVPGLTISFKLAPRVALGEGIDQIQRMEKGLPLPASITTSLSKRSGR